MKPTYITGNDHKAKYFSKMVGIDIPHQKLDIEEVQSLDLKEVVSKKALEAYRQLGTPVIVEDTSLRFDVLGSLPGTFIKWFLEELKAEGLCKLLDSYENRGATAGAMIAYYDGTELVIFERELEGSIARTPRGDSGFGWNRVFIPKGQDLTLGEMTEESFEHYYNKIKPFEDVRRHIDKA